MTNYPSIPGVYGGRSVAPRNLFKSGTPEFLPSLASVDATKTRDPGNDDPAVLRAGLLMGRVTAGGKYRAAVIGVTTADAANGATAVTVSAAQAVEVARLKALGGGGNLALKLIGPPAVGGTVATLTLTVTAVDTSTGILTCSAVAAAAVAGSIVAPSDGAQAPTQLLVNQYGADVTDHTGASQDVPMRLVRGGDVDVTMIVNYAGMDASVKAYV
ncbi:MAG: hypothetical protein JWO31_3028, partial [Phycisphaerales bacterium]|nr:hypothetical protein [Phycisphaerales bacterium]